MCHIREPGGVSMSRPGVSGHLAARRPRGTVVLSECERAADRLVAAPNTTEILTVTVEEGRITRIYSVANPDKLGRVDHEVALAR